MTNIQGHNSSGIDIFLSTQMAGSGVLETEHYIKDTLLPLLEKNYQETKAYLKGSTRKRVYGVKKALIDLLGGDDEIRIIRHVRKCHSLSSKMYESLFLMMESLNIIYFFLVAMKNKIPCTESNTHIHLKIRKAINETKALQNEFLIDVEANKCCFEQ